MPLTHCILHKIERSAPGADISTSLRSEENSSTSSIYSLFEQSKHSFQRSSQKQFGHFDQNRDDNPLPQWIKEQQLEKQSFLSLSKNIIADLNHKLDNTDEVFSAHVLIAIESIMDNPFLYVFWLQHTEATYIDSQLSVATSQYIDTKKIHYAFKLDINEWLEENSPKYLTTIIGRGNKTLAEAVTNTVGFSSGVDIINETKEFLSIVNDFTEALPADIAKDYKTKVIEYCVERDSIGEPVIIEELSTQLNDKEPLAFSSFVSDKQETIKPVIHTDRGSLKRFIRFFGRDKDMSISFSSGRFGNDIIFNEHTGQLTINQLPKSLKQQLSKHQDQSDTSGSSSQAAPE